ncbi:hypothetical protein RDI58_026807 [Solanum bulbocastanum]|uniref:Uncharacterized protein n=1 Tax=Solanum bulbocastanum TaxID=147425 RepID=A0AAN8T287_SOLBU
MNGYVENGLAEYVLRQLQLMAERVGLFIWNDHIDGNSRLFKQQICS